MGTAGKLAQRDAALTEKRQWERQCRGPGQRLEQRKRPRTVREPPFGELGRQTITALTVQARRAILAARLLTVPTKTSISVFWEWRRPWVPLSTVTTWVSTDGSTGQPAKAHPDVVVKQNVLQMLRAWISM